MDKIQTGEIIRALRKNKGITQEQLAEILEISTPAISKWESGQTFPDISLLPIIARYFQVTIDFLLGFSNELNAEDIKSICDELTLKFNDLQFMDAQKEWSDYLRQFPTQYSLKYELATIGVFSLGKANSIDEMYAFAHRLINVFEQCISSDELKIKQGSYFQIANLYIVLQDYNKAQAALNQIPKQLVNPNLLLSMVYVQKGNFEQARKSIQENIYHALTDIIAELGNMISVHRLTDSENTEVILDLFNKQKQITALFALEPINGIAIGLQVAHVLAENKNYEAVRIELEQVISILEKYPHGSGLVKDIPFFKDLDLELGRDSKAFFPVNAYRTLAEHLFILLEEDNTFQDIKSRLEQAL